MRKDITVGATARDTRGKNEARRLRVKGFMPAILYGTGIDPVAVTVSPKELTGILNSKTGHNTIFNLNVADKENVPVMIVDWQYDPVKDNLLHVDLKRIDLGKRISVKVPVLTVGDPKGVKLQGGIHEIITREVEIECLPDDIPEVFHIQVGEMLIGQSMRASDIPMIGSMKLLSPADAVISHVISLRAEEPVAADAAAAVPEPEVVKKGKKDEVPPAADAKKAPDAKKK